MIYTILNELLSRFPNVPAGVTYDGDNFFANISANDPQGECIEYSLIDGTLPYGAILDPLSGNISGILKLRDVANTTTYCHDYSWTFTIRATNNLDYTDQDFTIVVKHVNVPPLWVNAVVNSSEVVDLVNENINILGEYASNTDITIKLNAIYYQCAPLTFSLVTGDIPLGLSLSDDGIISGKLAKIPRGTSQHYYFTLNADDGIIMSTQAFHFTTTSLNIPPIWGANTFDLVYPAGEPINYTANAIQLEGYPLTYSIANGTLPNGITLSPSGLTAGLIYGTSDLVPSNTTYNFTILADDGVASTPHEFSITLYRIYWFSPDENLGQQIGGEDYDFTAVTRTSGLSGQTTYSLLNGSLPAGTSLNSTAGTITGKLTNASSAYTFTIRATNSGLNADRTFAGSVLGITTVKWISPDAGDLGPSSGGTLYRFVPIVLVENGVGQTKYSIISGAVPSGTSFNENTGQIIGILNNTIGSYAFTMLATNNGESESRDFSGTVTRSTAVSWISPASDLGSLKGGSSFSLISNVYVSNPSGPTIYSLANGALPNGTGIILNTNTGVIGGTLNNPATTSPSLTTPPETTIVLFTIRATNNGLAADRIFNGTVVAQYPPVWQTVANSIGDYPEGQPLNFRFVANDRNSDILTYSLAPDSYPLPNGLYLSNAGILSGTPLNTVTQTSQDNLSWVIVGIPLGNGHYDGRDIRVTASAKDNGYTIQENGYEIFQSKPYDSPFVATNSTFIPTIGIPYTVTYKIIKTVKETNGITPYIRPAFDAEDPNGVLASAKGTKTGYGYNSTIDMIDTTNWIIGQPYDISVTWTPDIQYVYARGRIRINRSYPDDNFGTYPYSNAVFKILNQDVKYFETDVTYKFTVNVTDNLFPIVHRSFSIKIKGATTVTWINPPEGAQSPAVGGSTYLLISNVSVKNPVGTTVYSVQSGTLPSGTDLNPNTGVITGTVPNASSSYNFTIRAINNGISADRAFSGIIGAATIVSWNSPDAGALPASKGGTAYSFTPNVSTLNPVGSTIYSIVSGSGSIPAGTTLNPSTGVISGTLTNATSSYSFTMRATNNGVSADRPFNGTVSIQYAPEWIYPNAGKIGEFVANQPINNGNGIQCSASDRDGDLLTYSLAQGSSLPSGLILSSSGRISGTPVNVVAQSALTGWYLIGPPYPYGHWDGALANVITSALDLSTLPIPAGAPAGYVAPNYTVYKDNVTNKIVFRSKEMYDYGPIYNGARSGDAPFITSDNTFVPKVGSTYKIVYSVKKIRAETNGIKSYLKPAFDAIYANGTVLANGTTVANETLNPALGTRSGFGYSNALDSVDTSSWIIGQSYDVIATWYVPPGTGFNNQDIQYSSARGRLRVNRSEPDSRLGTNAYSNAVFDITCQDIVYVNPRIDYNFYINVSDGILPPVPRLFSITIY